MNKHFYITSTLPYVNGEPHLGTVMEFIRADIIARYKRHTGAQVFFNCGTDEHGQKIYLKAQELGITPQEYVDQAATAFSDMKELLDLSWDRFIRTTDQDHKQAAQKFWNICDEKGYIYKKEYQTKYCIGCELEKQDSELENGECLLHPGKAIELREEENYFFAWSKFEDALKELYKNNKDFVQPDFRFNEIKSFVDSGIHDFSISRLKEKMAWGVPVPGDENHVMYVWFDALVNYISTLGWGSDDESQFETFWTNGYVMQICGKDNLRQQSAMWQGMLAAAGIKHSDKIYINGFINAADGQKMSKSLGNVIAPQVLIDTYGADAMRYYMARHVHNYEDSSFSLEKFHEAYMANLVNGIGNLTNRIVQMSSSYGVILEGEPQIHVEDSLLKDFDFNGELDRVMKLVGDLDQFITDEAPFKKIKEDESAAKEDLAYLLEHLYIIAGHLVPVMPQTAQKIFDAIKNNEKPEKPLFPRVELAKD